MKLREWIILSVCMMSLWLCPVAAQDTVLRDVPNPTRDKRTPKPSRPRQRNTRYIQTEHRHAATRKVQMRYRLSGIAGWLNRDDKIAGTKSMNGLTMDRPVVLGGSFAVEFLPTGRLESLRQWNNASVGIAFSAFDLGQKQYLGQVFAPHAYLNIPLVRKPHFVFGLRPGIGLAFVTKTYANTVPSDLKWIAYQSSAAVPYIVYRTEQPLPWQDMASVGTSDAAPSGSSQTVGWSSGDGKKQQIANISVGSIANAFLMGGFYMDFPVRKGWDITFSAGWQHLSNGSVMTPNAGYNMFNAEIGVAYTPGLAHNGMHYYPPYPDVPHSLYDGVKKKWDVEIAVGGGVRSVYYRDRKWFGVASLSVSAHWQPVSIFRLGGGVDVFYDGAYAYTGSNFEKTYIAESKQANCFRLGVSLQPEMVLGNFSFGYHLGVYLYDPVKNMEPYDEAAAGKLNRGIFYSYDPAKASTKQDGWFYQKVQLKYRCSKHLFVHLGLKVHIMKAEFIDCGIGVRI